MQKPKIRRAVESDISSIVMLYDSARTWLSDIGSDQWAANTKGKISDRVAGSVNRGECYVAEINGRAIGTITVDGYADPEFWNDGDLPQNALYVHRMVVDRRESGHNVGGQLLIWAEGLAAMKEKRWLRLDAWRTNRRLHDYYLSQGFVLVRMVTLSHRGSGALFQRAVGLVN